MSETSGRGILREAPREPAPRDTPPRERPPRERARRAAPPPAAAKLTVAKPGGPRPVVSRPAAPRSAAPRPAVSRPAVGKPAPAKPAAAKSAVAKSAARARASNRMPFIVLLCGLLGGALVSALVISTTLAEGAFQITNLQQSDSTLVKQQQQLAEEVATARSAQVIEQRAYQLGMRPSQLQFLNLKAGKIQSSAIAGSSATGSTP